MSWLELFRRDERGGVVVGIAKSAALIGFISVLAANYISSRTGPLDSERLAQVSAAVATGKPIDPLTTGSLRRAADTTRLDPCAVTR